MNLSHSLIIPHSTKYTYITWHQAGFHRAPGPTNSVGEGRGGLGRRGGAKAAHAAAQHHAQVLPEVAARGAAESHQLTNTEGWVIEHSHSFGFCLCMRLLFGSTRLHVRYSGNRKLDSTAHVPIYLPNAVFVTSPVCTFKYNTSFIIFIITLDT